LRHGLLDIPNARSSHVAPTPRGGGVAIVVVVGFALVHTSVVDTRFTEALLSITLGAALVAGIGFIDDRRGVSARIRFAVHSAAVMLLLGGTSSLGPLHVPGVAGNPVAESIIVFVALVWLLNLFNFMDGIDGIAGVEAAAVSLGLAACLYLGGGADLLLRLCLVVAAATLGFLAWNWPPARIFMGDVGSGFLGFMLGALAVLAVRSSAVTPWVPAILLAVFVVDATTTLLRRMWRRQRWYEAHRTHAYQILSRRFRGHLPVTLGVLLVNIFWLVPLALAATLRPEAGAVLALIAYAPLLVLALTAGAGKPGTT
jgi:Fuc2NAc and GlcNAc transferase